MCVHMFEQSVHLAGATMLVVGLVGNVIFE